MVQPPNLILASSSVGRKKLLSQLKIPFQVIPSTLDEEKIMGKNPLATLKLRAKLKGEEVAFKITQSSNNPITQSKKTRRYPLDARRFLILSADSGAIIDKQLIGKPKDYMDGVRILNLLSGRTHQFVTAIYLILLQQSETRFNLVKGVWESYELSYITFRKLTDEDIKRYLKVTDYTKYACGYAIASAQDFITKIEGSISNVIGLPLEKVIPILKENKLLK